ncbi:MAG: type II secretion system protein GspD [Firmicutes bacterium]|nr:type II secretion system protein GspD [Bacillota bacterium]
MVILRKPCLLLTAILVTLLIGSVAMASELDLQFDDVPFAQIYRMLGESQGLNVLVDPSVQGRGTFGLQGVSFEEALDLISLHSGYTYRLEGRTLLVSGKEPVQEEKVKEIRYVSTTALTPEEVFDGLALIMPRSDVYVQQGGGLVVLQGTLETLDRAEALLTKLDASKAAKPTITTDRSVLQIFKELSANMGLNLVADPALEQKRVFLNVVNQTPDELIAQIQQLVPLKVERTESTLMVASLADLSTERIKVYRLNYANPEATQSALTTLVPEGNVRIDEDRKSVIVRGTEMQLAEVDLFMIDFDTPLPQVVLEVWVQEMSTEALKNLGVEWKGLPSFSGGDAPVFFELQWEPWELILALRALEDAGDAKLLASPKIATLSGQEARIFVGDRVPIVLDDKEGERSIHFLESGINLRVTPRISDDGYVTILVRPEVSTFIWRTDTDFPQIRTREAETTVRVKDGQPIVLGGLLQEQESENISRIPFLSQLPLLGSLFQWKENKNYRTETTIFLIPRIVDGDHGVVDQGFFTAAQ